MVEYGVAKVARPGEGESGDQYLVRCSQSGILVAAIDGIGHGEEAANAAKLTCAALSDSINEPLISLVQQSHEKLRRTRGVVLSLASIDMPHGLLTWLGIGNVQGVLKRSDHKNGGDQEALLLRGGVVGAQLPSLQATVLPIAQGDTLYFATDGIRSGFSDSLSAKENPQRAADRLLGQFRIGTDDALVLVVRFTGIR